MKNMITALGLCLLLLLSACTDVGPSSLPGDTTDASILTQPSTDSEDTGFSTSVPSVTAPPVTNPPETNPPVTNPPETDPPVTLPEPKTVTMVEAEVEGGFYASISEMMTFEVDGKPMSVGLCRVPMGGLYLIYDLDRVGKKLETNQLYRFELEKTELGYYPQQDLGEGASYQRLVRMFPDRIRIIGAEEADSESGREIYNSSEIVVSAKEGGDTKEYVQVGIEGDAVMKVEGFITEHVALGLDYYFITTDASGRPYIMEMGFENRVNMKEGEQYTYRVRELFEDSQSFVDPDLVGTETDFFAAYSMVATRLDGPSVRTLILTAKESSELGGKMHFLGRDEESKVRMDGPRLDGWSYRWAETPGEIMGNTVPTLALCDDRAALDAYAASVEDIFDLSATDGERESFAALTERYNEAWFEANRLVIIRACSGSPLYGSEGAVSAPVVHRVNGLYDHAMIAFRLPYSDGYANATFYHILVELDRVEMGDHTSVWAIDGAIS